MEIKTTEFFKNIKKLPPEDSEEFKQLIDWEIEKCTGGVMINGVYISGWLYFHINHWYIRIDTQDNFGNDVRIESLPELRDNEWIRAEYLEQCRKEKKGYMEVGGRQSGKSEMEASYFGMNATLFRNTQNVIVCGNDNDLSLLKDKVDFGLRKLWKGISIPRLDKTWRLNQIRLGYKTPDGEDEIWSYIIIRNAKDGNNTEVAAGTTAKTFIMDEVGKYPFASAFKAAEPAFKGKFGWRAVPILVGTGGAFEHGKDAENFFYNPASNNFLGVPNEKTNNDTAIFLSGLYRQDCKEETTLDKWLETEKGILIPNNSELSKIKINVANKEKAQQLIEKEREAAKTNPDRTLFLKQKMYYPLTVDECFLTENQNIFDVEACKRQKARLLSQERTGTSVELFHDGEKICHKFSDKLPISNFPLRPNDSKDAPVVIYEFPVENPPYGLYVAGVDSYKTGQAKYSDSLGTIYIFKRMTSISGEGYQNMIVASYAARPDKKETWEEQARLLIKYYNARTLVENDELSFIDYMIAKGDARYLETQPEWLKEIVPNTTVKRDYGIHRSAEKIRNFLHGCAKKYMEEVVHQEKDEDGSITKETLGVTKIFDPVLLEELAQYNDDGNFDRVIACFTEGNRVLTKYGYKNIEDVTIDDEVLSHTGNYNKVLNTSKVVHKNELIRIKTIGEDSIIECTPDHPFLVKKIERGKGKYWYSNTKIGEFEWRAADNLSLQDFLLIPKRKFKRIKY